MVDGHTYEVGDNHQYSVVESTDATQTQQQQQQGQCLPVTVQVVGGHTYDVGDQEQRLPVAAHVWDEQTYEVGNESHHGDSRVLEGADSMA